MDPFLRQKSTVINRSVNAAEVELHHAPADCSGDSKQNHEVNGAEPHNSMAEKRKGLHVVENQRERCSDVDENGTCAADFSPRFHRRVVRTFAETLSVKETARQLSRPHRNIPARVVTDIVLAHTLERKPPAVELRGVRTFMQVAR